MFGLARIDPSGADLRRPYAGGRPRRAGPAGPCTPRLWTVGELGAPGPRACPEQMIGSKSRMQGKVQLEARSASPVYVGIDVCKDHLDVYLHPLAHHCRVTNDRDGLRRLKRLLVGHRVNLIVMEATAKYHRQAHRSLSQSGLAVAGVNPMRSRLFA